MFIYVFVPSHDLVCVSWIQLVALAVAVAMLVAVALALALAVTFIGFCVTISTP